MDWKDWVRDTSSFPEIQEQIEKDCEMFVKTFFPADDKYGQEKFLKLYHDNLRNLESCSLRARGIHPSQYQDKLGDMEFRRTHPALQEEVRRIMESETRRAARFARTYLSSVQARANGQGQEISQLLNVAREITANALASKGAAIHPEQLARLAQAVVKLDVQARMKENGLELN